MKINNFINSNNQKKKLTTKINHFLSNANNTNRNRVNLYHKHQNGNNPYLPSIYKNKYTNSVNKYAVKKKY